MKLQFLGTAYYHNPSKIDTIKSELSGKFLGKPYQLRRPIFQSSLTSKNLKYRGVSY